ncbi:hypothetical protein [Fructobacillus fructosus]|uniref:Uncharacterized protein n=1 Tax=Fructobacillus fructosus TaxID=1631 RepID=A0ABN9Z043_9LACO|nr:hypothetical protein R53140_OCIKHKEL_01135 [Fructobacillus fructosus]CAK1250147.1 hypothetical protein LMG30235_GOPAMIKF_01363 [Fructobacillus fructosus]CAK1252322.1 hypothetical protein R54839_PPFHFPJH_01442 [Fructobacillus fructosus]CAK1252474.1 hypothetical protein LMG30234_GAICNKDF_01488 [Fructobacillus fructosus]CAK1252563.1 hypothetical protein R54866_LGPIEIPA_01492 [Fructobacillus fructosus]
MNTESIKQEILRAIEPLWKKEPNTLYGLRVVLPQFDNPVGLFFEWNKIGRATISRAILTYPSDEVEAVLTAVHLLEHEKGLTVSIYK